MQRVVNKIVQVDYTDKAAFEKDIPRMNKSGYMLIQNGMYDGHLHPSEIKGDDRWKYTAYYTKSFL